MSIIQNIYFYFQSLFEFFTFKHKPSYSSLSDIENPEDYETIALKNEIHEKMDR
jgi:hypothetical protein